MTQEIFNAQTESQLKILSEISVISEKLEIEFWLRGGWAIDFLLGKITRSHDDIDLVTWIQNRERLEDALAEAGYEHLSVRKQFRNRQTDFHKNNVEVTFSYITYSDKGQLIMNGLPEWIWRTDSLLSPSFMLHGISANVLNPKQLLEEKEVYEQIGRTTRLKDIESKKILHCIISDFS
ncbi:nucleotidyltransferase domain-containing protein [Psychrobacillus sp. NPDC096426]|uniref:nucleotidyltransferase domain-containing protein n=1 Tax=Psychrobacillus sp. NPDC096426 TaxID=3364491 RepID=UPI0038182CB0